VVQLRRSDGNCDSSELEASRGARLFREGLLRKDQGGIPSSDEGGVIGAATSNRRSDFVEIEPGSLLGHVALLEGTLRSRGAPPPGLTM